MLQDFLKTKLIDGLGFLPTASQEEAAGVLGEFLAAATDQSAFILKGYAGTGKTTMVKAVVQVLSELKQKAFLLAPTGRAAKVLSNSVGMPAYTIHKKIYRQQSSKDGFAAFDLNKNLHKDTLFVVDEASMIANDGSGSLFGSGRLLDDLLKFIFSGSNCRVLFIGDDAQLPPVGISLSPALEKGNLEAYGLTVYDATLTDVVRQKADSGILTNATHLRDMLEGGNQDSSFPEFVVAEFPDFFRITGAELMEELDYCYNHFGQEETLVVCRTNKRANLYNQGIRNTMLFREEELTVGDYLLVMKNNYHWVKEEDKINFIANGDIAEVARITGHQELYGRRFADVVLRLVDYKEVELDVKLLMDSVALPGAGLKQEEQEAFFYKVMEDYQDESDAKKRFDSTRENDFYNALQVKFAYAMTCHKSQGGQWKAVFVDLGYFTEEYLSRDFLRWLYTAVTRGTERVYLVNFPDTFFQD
ncbi:ATP-dependent RecD-like DNA helicase [Marinilabilia salmonicolor]|uniref:Exodeoxyribonuclease-5 n=1 Tax=Marinilabilia salmonicolor TaxID=989 RepID=A0A2T0XAQ1_9BACT|nr:AAA family ATPase [Marinilabilia salmonicolor]PRY96016.1 exodeoxyribonuclease-5 [Marinilabilia salmonicolor]RCW29431.1 exodeoxyribonuclease-5 [Marinilabilia salmonicolor]